MQNIVIIIISIIIVAVPVIVINNSREYEFCGVFFSKGEVQPIKEVKLEKGIHYICIEGAGVKSVFAITFKK